MSVTKWKNDSRIIFALVPGVVRDRESARKILFAPRSRLGGSRGVTVLVPVRAPVPCLWAARTLTYLSYEKRVISQQH